MIDGKKIIGVCITKIQEVRNINLVDNLHDYAEKNNSKLIVFNSYSDFYTGRKYDDGAKAIYDVINYDVMDAIVIYPMCFCKKEIVQNIVDKAKAHSVPVILIDEEQEGCYSVIADYFNAYKELINHVLTAHGAKDTLFIGGYAENDKISAERTECYKQAMSENGLAISDNNIAYGEYWQDPVYEIIDNIVENRKKLPEAIFCANDSMALAACDRLKKHGLSIPSDTIVTGFDGIPAADFYKPRLSTCYISNTKLAESIFNTINEALNGKAPFSKKADVFEARISESCGCETVNSENSREEAIELFRTLEDMETLDDLMHTKTDRALEAHDMNSLYETVSTALDKSTYVCVAPDFLAIAMGNKETSNFHENETMAVIPSSLTGEVSSSLTFSISDMVPELHKWLEDSSMYVLNTVFVDDNACGYFATKVHPGNSMRYIRKAKRVFNAVNIAFNISTNYFKQLNMINKMEQVSLKNPTTGLPNLKGATKWFNTFAENPENHKKPFSISVYNLPKYTYIYENYGVDDIETALRFVAEALKLANPSKSFIAHIADDEFMVLNYYDDYTLVGDTINSATGIFYQTIESYNSSCGKEYYVEVSAGCTVIDTGWDSTFENYLKAANNEMYMNRLKLGSGAAVKEKKIDTENYKAFELLIEKNLFSYHFQPIVSAKTGEIYAYEALMRTDASIGMNPLEVLETAKSYRKLYEIEKATVFNVMERVANDQESFGDCKVFINTIPGNFLRESDRAEIQNRYGNQMGRYFFELTESNSVSDEDLNTIKEFTGSGQIAIDDFGAGHSNIVNLMRYTPQIIKIDRFLITDIHKDQNKQMFVRSTIDFAKVNGIKVLAEGVETYNEMSTVIDLGVDYIQGYYTGRPAPQPVKEINPDIKNEIFYANPLFGQERK